MDRIQYLIPGHTAGSNTVLNVINGDPDEAHQLGRHRIARTLFR
jgi:hypothetical protein